MRFNGNHLRVLKWNEWIFWPPFGTYGLNWARKTSWGWWGEWDDTALQTQDSRPITLALGRGGPPQYRIFTSERGRKFLFLWNLNARSGDQPAFSSLNHALHKDFRLHVAITPSIMSIVMLQGKDESSWFFETKGRRNLILVIGH